MILTATEFVDAAHFLTPKCIGLTSKKCLALHGHTYKIEVEIATKDCKRFPMVVDFGAVKDVIRRLDHQCLNDIFANDEDFKDMETTAENIACWLADNINEALPSDRMVVAVRVWEGYKGDDSNMVEVMDI